MTFSKAAVSQHGSTSNYTLTTARDRNYNVALTEPTPGQILINFNVFFALSIKFS